MTKVINMNTYIKGMKTMEKMKNKKSGEFFETIVKRLKDNGNGTEYTPKQAAKIADEILQKASIFGYENQSETPIIKIINAFGIDVRRAKRMPKENAGVIYAGGKTKEVYGVDTIIFTDSKELFEHQRFIMAHELAHYLFDYIGNPKNREADYTFEETYPRKNHDSKKEIRANRFAAELLMPATLFAKQYCFAMDQSNDRVYTIIYLAKYFQVKEASVEKRIYEVLYNGGY